MKKILLFTVAIATLSLFASCSKNEDLPKAKVKVNIAVSELETGTKAVKTGWEAYDKIHVYLDDATTYTPDFDLTFDGIKWVASEIPASVVERLKATGGFLRGFWEQSGLCMGSPWDQWTNWIEFPSSDKKETTGILVYLVADFSSIAYTYDGSTISANINTWRFRTDMHIVVTGITHTPGKYTLYSDDIDNCQLINTLSGSAPYKIEVGYQSTGSYNGRIGGIKNDEGVAFVGGLSSTKSTGSEMTLYLIDNSTSKTYSYTRVMPSTFEKNESILHAVKIPFSSFVEVTP